jgi:hypothetical protein
MLMILLLGTRVCRRSIKSGLFAAGLPLDGVKRAAFDACE